MKLDGRHFAVCLGVFGSAWLEVDAAIVPVTGVHTGVDPVKGTYPPRLRLQDLQKTGPQWDLYIQALASWQSVSEDDELSYFGLSGIHGRPYVSWNGVEHVEGAPVTGYCTHNEALFAIWHRPLVAVFEQILARYIQEVATQYTGERAETYRRAADTWRHPYWDWAADKALPDVVIQPNIAINSANGTLTMSNPLLQYKFHQFPLNATLFPPGEDYNLDTYPETLRCPDPTTNRSNPGMADDNVGGIDLAGQVYNIYSRVFDFESMSSTAFNSMSFEQEHNEIHVAVGCLHPMGHFAHLGYSGFDPIFMMHHAAIDRHVALWQAIHYNASMFTIQYTTNDGQFATAPGTNITANSPLKPFYADAQGAFHTSNSARDVATFGYSYPELLEAQAEVEAAGHTSNGSTLGSATLHVLSRAVVAKVNKLYGPNATTATAQRAAMEQIQTPSKAYFVRVGIEKAGLPLPAMVNVFLGATFAGRLLLLTSPPRGRVHGEVDLRKVLEQKDTTATAASTEEYIRQSFRWEVVTQHPSPSEKQQPPSEAKQQPPPDEKQQPPSDEKQQPPSVEQQHPAPSEKQHPSPSEKQQPLPDEKQHPPPSEKQQPPSFAWPCCLFWDEWSELVSAAMGSAGA